MTEQTTLVLLALSIALLVTVGVLLFSARPTATSQAVVRRLRRSPDPFTLKIGKGGAAWDPSRSAAQGTMRWGEATATYSLDEHEVVHLRYQPKSGAEESREGPIPSTPEKSRRVRRSILAIYVLVLAAGFTIAYFVSAGSEQERLVWGVGGVLAAMTLVWICALAGNVVKAVHDYRHQRYSPPSW